MITFSGDFLWGTASCGYMTEGGITTDAWYPYMLADLELPPDQRKFAEPVGEACDYWNRFDEDHRLAAELGVQVHRLSTEWARVEPRPGEYDLEAVDRYGEMLDSLHEHGIQTMLTLNHFIIPAWMEEQGGYLNPTQFLPRYSAYVKLIVDRIGDKVDFWLTINEPNVIPSTLYLGLFPPFVARGMGAYIKSYRLLMQMHGVSYGLIKEKHPSQPVGVAFNWMYMRPFREGNLLDRLGVWFNNRGANEAFFDGVKWGRYCFPIGLGGRIPEMKGSLDFIGLNYYACHFCRGLEALDTRPGEPTTERGRSIWPEGIYLALKRLGSRFNLPILITENGVATTDEDFRIKHITAHLAQIHKAKEEGVPVKGYMYWSLTDNWEWTWGFKMRFGLIHIDYQDQQRTIKKSGEWYRDLISSRKLEIPDDLSFHK